jgi:hypothetical protein
MALLTLAVLLLLLGTLIDARPARGLDRNVTSHLDRRECRRVNGPGPTPWICDYQLPSIPQIVEQLKGPSNGQGVNADRVAVFVSTADDQTTALTLTPNEPQLQSKY